MLASLLVAAPADEEAAKEERRAAVESVIREVDEMQITATRLARDIPGYTVFDVRGGYRLTEDARVEVALENLLDKKYRPLHSRTDAPGFGIRVGLTVDF